MTLLCLYKKYFCFSLFWPFVISQRALARLASCLLYLVRLICAPSKALNEICESGVTLLGDVKLGLN